jgi:hypothetical protein
MVKPELPVSPRQADVLVAGRCGDSKLLKSYSKAKLRSKDWRERKLHTIMLFPPFRHTLPKPWGPSPMMFHPYAPWFGWYAPPMQYESFYPRLTKHEPNAFDSSAHPRKDRLYPKRQLNATKTQEQPNWNVQFGNPEVLVFPAQVGHIGLKKVYRVKQKTNSNESLNLNIQDEKPMFTNDKKRHQSTDSNSGARTGGYELEKELSPMVSANEPTGQNAKPKDDVPTSFSRITRHASKVIRKSKKMMWVPKVSILIKAELITWTSTARTTLKSEPHMTTKVLLSNHTNKKADPWGHDRTWSSRR